MPRGDGERAELAIIGGNRNGSTIDNLDMDNHTDDVPIRAPPRMSPLPTGPEAGSRHTFSAP
ncbi:hypothetical protein GCM10010171_50890 [Actinokineospora fastidiosa]|uniref:Uncharacterized protein n=1 Tax=Actinokineospora fastidiosa TaxID=1816 RepID=A0A918GNL6_9PSEU|nr:hypothetical protein GCM10010171_50890 [Actinokineospora fastidiosa]